MSQRQTLNDPTRCPLCLADNHCVVAVGEAEATSCWCWTEQVSPSLLQRIPTELRGQVCVCRQCVVDNHRDAWPDLPTVVQMRLSRIRRDR
jgi:hypothetical protein